MKIRLEQDVESVDRQRVLDEDGSFIGFIHRVRPDAWQNRHVAEGGPLSPVPEGPFPTLELAFDAFKKALGSQ